VSKTQEPSEPPDSRSEKRSADEFWRLMAHYAPAIGLVPASIFAGYMIGYGLDYLLSTTFLRFVFLILGFISGTVQLIRLLGRDME
jgi:F0F1-type ATP synthase assembly protein I